MQIPRGKAGKTLIAEVTRLIRLFNTLPSRWFWQFSQKKQQFSVALPTP